LLDRPEKDIQIKGFSADKRGKGDLKPSENKKPKGPEGPWVDFFET
jgi:hypothetical protein